MDVLEQLGIHWQLLVMQIAGFLVLFAILKKVAFGPVAGILEERQRRIRGQLGEAEQRRQEMERMRDEYQARIADIESEARERIQQAIREAHTARDELLAQAREQAEHLLSRAQQEIKREKEKALVEVRDQVADLALLAAGRVVEKTLDERTHRALIDDILEEVGRN